MDMVGEDDKVAIFLVLCGGKLQEGEDVEIIGGR